MGMKSIVTTVAGIGECRITRCGYTGEDGVEISVPQERAQHLVETILGSGGQPALAGLGARDSLRLEAGLCLYGNDIDENTSPVEAGLVWTIGGPKSRRRTQQGFLGAQGFLEPSGKLKEVSRKRVGITGMKAPAREHTEVYATEEESSKIGEITSGGFGPSVKMPIAMGYVATAHAKEGTNVFV